MQQSHITTHHLIDDEHSHHPHHQRHRHRLLFRKFFTDFRRQSSIHDYQLPNTLVCQVPSVFRLSSFNFAFSFFFFQKKKKKVQMNRFELFHMSKEENKE